MIRLEKVSPEKRALLWNIHQKYLYEMTNYYGDELDENGNYRYRYFDAYFSEPERKALLIYGDQVLIGFAMVNPYSYIGENPDYVLAEFTIFPMYRKRHWGKEAAEHLLKTYGGRWEIKYSEKNAGAKAFWAKVTNAYQTVKKYSCGNGETVLSFSTAEDADNRSVNRSVAD